MAGLFVRTSGWLAFPHGLPRPVAVRSLPGASQENRRNARGNKSRRRSGAPVPHETRSKVVSEHDGQRQAVNLSVDRSPKNSMVATLGPDARDLATVLLELHPKQNPSSLPLEIA